VLEKSVLRW